MISGKKTKTNGVVTKERLTEQRAELMNERERTIGVIHAQDGAIEILGKLIAECDSAQEEQEGGG